MSEISNPALLKKLILLSPLDNVYIVSQDIGVGETLMVGDQEVTLSVAVSMGHKIARMQINKGQNILKYGFPIGVASQLILKGEHAHIHNISSNYTETHSLNQTSSGKGEGK